MNIANLLTIISYSRSNINLEENLDELVCIPIVSQAGANPPPVSLQAVRFS